MSDFERYIADEKAQEAASLLGRFRDNIEAAISDPQNYVCEITYPKPIIALAIGELTAVAYKPLRQETTFFHRFQASDRPLLFVSSDGSQILVGQGAYRFTERGFVK